jgi:mannose-6-phosphate isomerase-like protein (cupin superfamily)
MADPAVKEPKTQRSWDRPEGASFASWMESRVARLSTRKYDWDALKFQADYDPKYRRAQMRYVGTGGTGVKSDVNVVPAEHFTFSTMVIPAGHIGPMHIHTDVEEIFFVMRGKMKVICEKRHDDGRVERWEATLGDRDLISIPRRLSRGAQHRRGGRAHVRDAWRAEADHADLSAGIAAREDQAVTPERR